MKYSIFNLSTNSYLTPSNAFLAKTFDAGAKKFHNFDAALGFLYDNFSIEDRKILSIRDEEGTETNIIELEEKSPLIKKLNTLNSLKKRLSLVDLSTQDILHKIEFDYLDAEEKINLVNKLCQIRHERRVLKDDIDELEIYEKYRKYIALLSLELNRLHSERAERSYSPRVLTELFEN